MLTKLTIRNFKRFRNVEVELGNPVVFIGPNNSGKTTRSRRLRYGILACSGGSRNGVERKRRRSGPA